jgi:hypothetical protein
MRPALLLLILVALSGCSFSVSGGVVPKTNAPAVVRTLQVAFADTHATAPAPVMDEIDLSAVAHSALTVPREIEGLRRAVVISCVVLATIGSANAVLLIFLLTWRRVGVPETAVVAVQALPEVKTCRCGAVISARTKSGRCRQCARDHRNHGSFAGVENG